MRRCEFERTDVFLWDKCLLFGRPLPQALKIHSDGQVVQGICESAVSECPLKCGACIAFILFELQKVNK